ncbi:MAG: beta-mannosidase [Planctomycetia bacterium]|nr:beta-mannosidase [Planctomycetia bacterium]
MKKMLYLLFGFWVTGVLAQAPGDVPPDKGPIAHHFRITPRVGNAHLDLSHDWQFGCRDRSATTYAKTRDVEKWYVMKRPMTVQRALCEAGVLPEPFAGMNSKEHEWVEQKIWYFQKKFTLPEGYVGDYVFLSFDGLDYYSRVWLNGTHLGRHEGMFGGPEFEVSKLLKADGENEIVVAVASANYGQPQLQAYGGRFVKPWSTSGGSGVEPFYTLGFWRGARLDFVKKTHLERPYLVTKSVENGQAKIALETEVLSGTHSLDAILYKPYNYQLSNGNVGQPWRKSEGDFVVRLEMKRGERTFTKEFPFEVLSGRTWLREEFTLDQPELWWPNGLGDQPLYDVTITLLKEGETLDRIAFPFGLRTLTWETSAGPKLVDRWGDWQCVVNGEKVFLKGCNWMPVDVLRDLPPEKYRWYLGMVRDAGIRILRIWGPGLREDEAFYDACDRYGILVWQDFSIGNSDVAGWPHNVFESEVLQTIWRLRNRTSLAVWCGGNEFNPYCPGNTAAVGIIERNLREFDPSRKFVRTSPDEGSYHTYPDMDATWYKRLYAKEPFLAESGIHSVCTARSLSAYINPEEFQHVDKMYLEEYRKLAPESVHHFVEYQPSRVPRMLTRASHFVTMKNMTLDDMALGTQLGAGEFYQVMSEGVQANYPVTTGIMPWVFARSWPTLSAIQLVDGTGQPVAPYYFLKRTYEPIHAMLDMERLLWKSGETFPITCKTLNLNRNQPFTGTLRVRILDDTLKTVYDAKKPVETQTLGVVEFTPFAIPENYKNRFFFPVVEFFVEGKCVSRSTYWPRTMARMENPDNYNAYRNTLQVWPAAEEGFPVLRDVLANAPRASLKLEITNETSCRDGDYRITEYAGTVSNTGTAPSLLTWFDLAPAACQFVASDAFFYLEAGETKAVWFRVRERWSASPLEKRWRVESWNCQDFAE